MRAARAAAAQQRRRAPLQASLGKQLGMMALFGVGMAVAFRAVDFAIGAATGQPRRRHVHVDKRPQGGGAGKPKASASSPAAGAVEYEPCANELRALDLCLNVGKGDAAACERYFDRLERCREGGLASGSM